MPFGAEPLANGTIRFQLWAPAAQSVDLCLMQGMHETIYPMGTPGGGWFCVETAPSPLGSRYCYRIDGNRRVPDPASRFQPEDVHGPSEVVNPTAWEWQDEHWRGRPWEEAAIYELHVGSFTAQGTFRAVIERLDHLVELGITALELMPVGDFPGHRNWGYDGVLPFAPDSRYGRPEDLKALVEAAHARELMVFLDVVYNHFGPEGNYLHGYAPQFFTERHHTPWGDAINFDGRDSRWVRQFFIHNALYWLDEYHLDGLRIDAVHAVYDDSQPDILEELATAVHAGPGRARHIHLVLENDHNAARYLTRDTQGRPSRYVAQWNDDVHHALHVLATGEHSGYYVDYADAPIRHLGRCLTEGFSYQGEPSIYRDGAVRGEPSTHLPPSAFVSFLQNHDQVGNRAFGERISTLAPSEAVTAATALLLLAPAPPLLFMGQEWGATEPFPFFCDFGPDLAALVTEGRRREFARFPEFTVPGARARIPDPAAPQTFESALLDWRALEQSEGQRWLALHHRLLALRRQRLLPHLRADEKPEAGYDTLGERALKARWRWASGSYLLVLANLGPAPVAVVKMPRDPLLFATPDDLPNSLAAGTLPPWGVAWFLHEVG